MKSKLAKKRDNPRSTYWKRRADALWGEYQHLPNACAMHGASGHTCAGKLEAHHIISRSVVCLRHEPTNGVLLCSLGHKYCTRLSPHAAPVGFTSWLERWYPVKAAWVKANLWRTGQPDYKAACEKLEAAIKQQASTRNP